MSSNHQRAVQLLAVYIRLTVRRYQIVYASFPHVFIRIYSVSYKVTQKSTKLLPVN
jgi:hypothetical protein